MLQLGQFLGRFAESSDDCIHDQGRFVAPVDAAMNSVAGLEHPVQLVEGVLDVRLRQRAQDFCTTNDDRCVATVYGEKICF